MLARFGEVGAVEAVGDRGDGDGGGGVDGLHGVGGGGEGGTDALGGEALGELEEGVDVALAGIRDDYDVS